MEQLFAYQLQKGDIEAGTECQARDGYLNLKDWVVKCPECGSYTHQDCWKGNGNTCPRQGCDGEGTARIPAPSKPQLRPRRSYQLPSRFLSPLQVTDSAIGLLAQTCGRDGGRFLIGDKIIRCPVCGTPYHEHCWKANGHRCSQPGCTGFKIIWSSQLGSYRSPSFSPVYPEPESFLVRLIKLPFRIIGFLIRLVVTLIVIAIFLIVIYFILSAVLGF
jgi:hypothetical protein